MEESRKRGRKLNMKWIDYMKESIGIIYRSCRAIEAGTLWTSLIPRVTKNWSQHNGMQHTHGISELEETQGNRRHVNFVFGAGNLSSSGLNNVFNLK